MTRWEAHERISIDRLRHPMRRVVHDERRSATLVEEAPGRVPRDHREARGGPAFERSDGSGEFVRVTLRPRIKLASGDPPRALALHHRAHELCFVASSVRFPVEVQPSIAE